MVKIFETTKQPVFAILSRSGKVFAKIVSDNKTNHINGLRKVLCLFKKTIRSRKGIRKERLLLYLTEYVWWYNNRDLTINQQIEKLLNLVAKI